MANHPNRAPQHAETFADLIARRPERLNILVAATETAPGLINATGRIVSDPRSANAVRVRYGWSPVEIDDDPRMTGVRVPALSSGAPDAAGIRAAVARLRAAWGPLHVQDNSRAVPDLDQGKWRG
jgi:hypothetical protein